MDYEEEDPLEQTESTGHISKMKLRNSTNVWLFKELKVIFCSIITVGGKTQRMPSPPPQNKANPYESIGYMLEFLNNLWGLVTE